MNSLILDNKVLFIKALVARFCVSFKTRNNVRRYPAWRVNGYIMNEDWFDRLEAAIKADGRDMKTISLAAKCGPNYVQQMLKERKRPGVDKFISIISVLGSAKAFEILTGQRLNADDLEFIRMASLLDPEAKKAAVSFFQSLKMKQDTEEPSVGS